MRFSSTDISSADQIDKRNLEKNEIGDNADRYVFIDSGDKFAIKFNEMHARDILEPFTKILFNKMRMISIFIVNIYFWLIVNTCRRHNNSRAWTLIENNSIDLLSHHSEIKWFYLLLFVFIY